MAYLEWRRKRAALAGEGYGSDLRNEPETADDLRLPNHPLVALSPLVLVGVANLLFTHWIPGWYPAGSQVELPGLAGKALPVNAHDQVALWAVMGALIAGIVTILLVLASGFAAIRSRLSPKAARARWPARCWRP